MLLHIVHFGKFELNILSEEKKCQSNLRAIPRPDRQIHRIKAAPFRCVLLFFVQKPIEEECAMHNKAPNWDSAVAILGEFALARITGDMSVHTSYNTRPASR